MWAVGRRDRYLAEVARKAQEEQDAQELVERCETLSFMLWGMHSELVDEGKEDCGLKIVITSMD